MTGIFSGSFNPIHIGHLALANWICEYGGIDELWFLVSPHTPFKDVEQMTDKELRLQLVEAAIAGYPRFKASAFEFCLSPPYYTIDTMHALRKQYPERDFTLIIGADNWRDLPLWKDSEALVAEFPIVVYPRAGYDTVISERYQNVRFVDAPLIEISSTFIRHALQTGKDVRFFLPDAARERIRDEKLFVSLPAE